ncbi:rho GTPase-activating protein 28 isoform X1 [Python bivittatus]|uniref:Rho GTPase-activating protein 28 isoform X1 n=1 Tax=Python bivittatus TaxID=176946 RepID=A0A9F5MX52_PYTBI|nr:rho GTPase-activating protein 28 isoform X1 [Python bivittatus]
MEIKDSGSVVLTAYHSYTPSRLPSSVEHSFAPESPPVSSRSPLRKSLPRCQRVSRMLSNESLRPVYSRSNSQASVDSTSMEDFWCEVENIKESTEERQDEQTLLEVKPPDEGELEAEWLQDVGLSTLISESEEDNGEALLSTLTRTQAAAVQKRYTTYSQTMRKKNKHTIRDVRDIFGIHNSSPTFETITVLPVTTNGIQLSVKNPGWKMVSSSDCMEYEFNKDSQLEKEELSLEISFSESIMVVPKHRECHKNQRLKKDDSALPNYTIRKSRLGSTEVGDLSLDDMKKIRYLSLIELTAFYDALGIELKRNRTERMKRRENGLFGVPLTVLLENDQKKVPGIKVPLIFQKLLLKLEETGLETEGILRVPGSASRVKSLRQEIEAKFDEDTFDWDQVRNNDAAGLLKMFVRELPTPLFPVEYLPAFITLVEKISKIKLQLQALHLLIMLLPDASRDAAKALLQFLKKVVANQNKNKMTLWNVSMIVAPNLFIYKGKHANQEEMLAAATTAHVVRLLIKYQDILWMVPTFLISQVRKMNEATMNNTKRQLMFDKGVRKLLRRKTMERERPERTESDIPEGVIRVHAPLHSKVSMAIQPNNQTKANDIVARFYCENRHGSSEELKMPIQSLYEIGGNIGEHCLDPDAYMLDVYRANPQAEWVIKPKRSSVF